MLGHLETVVSLAAGVNVALELALLGFWRPPIPCGDVMPGLRRNLSRWRLAPSYMCPDTESLPPCCRAQQRGLRAPTRSPSRWSYDTRARASGFEVTWWQTPGHCSSSCLQKDRPRDQVQSWTQAHPRGQDWTLGTQSAYSHGLTVGQLGGLLLHRKARWLVPGRRRPACLCLQRSREMSGEQAASRVLHCPPAAAARLRSQQRGPWVP